MYISTTWQKQQQICCTRKEICEVGGRPPTVRPPGYKQVLPQINTSQTFETYVHEGPLHILQSLPTMRNYTQGDTKEQ